MPSRRSDIRKFIPDSDTLSSDTAKKYTLRQKNISFHDFKEKQLNNVISPKGTFLDILEAKNRSKKSYGREVTNTKSDADSKRRRSSAENYINRRFLYDVVEPPKRTRHRKVVNVHQSESPLLTVSSPNMKRYKSKRVMPSDLPNDDDMFVFIKSRRDRRLKRKSEYIVSDVDDIKPIADKNTDNISKKHKSKYKSCEYPKKVNLKKNDYCNSDKTSVDLLSIKDYSTDGLPSYSDSLLDDLHVSSDYNLDHNGDINSHVAITNRLETKNRLLRKAFTNGLTKDTEESMMQGSIFINRNSPPAHINHTALLDFCTSTQPECYESMGSPAALVDGHVDLEAMDSHNVSNRRIQNSQEESEEDLLAPELSKLANSNGMSASDSALVSNLTETATIVGPCFTSGSSRRKSPVRPMQVLRTKTSNNIPNNQSTQLGQSCDTSAAYMLPTSEIPGKRIISDAELNHTDNILTSVLNGSQNIPIHVGCPQFEGISTKDSLVYSRKCDSTNPELNIRCQQMLSSISPSAISNTAQVSLCIDVPAQSNNSPSSSLLPALLNQPIRSSTQTVIPRNFVTSLSRSTAGVTKQSTNVSFSNGTASVRRRPTILKRALVSGNPPSIIPHQQDTDCNSNTPVSRPISLFIAANSQSRKDVAESSRDESTSNAVGTSTSTKLLQLVTTSVPNSTNSTNQTASDRLFGKRTTSYNKINTSGLTKSVRPTAVVQTGSSNDVKPVSTNNLVNTNMPYRYAVVRGSADGKQYVLISNPKVNDQNAQQQTTTMGAVDNSTVNENYNGNQMFSVGPCLRNVYKVEIDGSHLFQTEPNEHDNLCNLEQHNVYATSGTPTLTAT